MRKSRKTIRITSTIAPRLVLHRAGQISTQYPLCAWKVCHLLPQELRYSQTCRFSASRPRGHRLRPSWSIAQARCQLMRYPPSLHLLSPPLRSVAAMVLDPGLPQRRLVSQTTTWRMARGHPIPSKSLESRRKGRQGRANAVRRKHLRSSQSQSIRKHGYGL